MPTIEAILAFAAISLGMVLTPGPNMIYLISRSICQGRVAGFFSLAGVATGFFVYLILAAVGLTALIFAVPFAYDALRIAGAIYLAWLAWNALKPGGKSAFEVSDLPEDSPLKLYAMGLLTNLLNPKIAILYLSLLPQFITPEHGSVLLQSIILGTAQIVVSIAVNSLVILSASAIAVFLQTRPTWARMQRYLMGTVLGGLAISVALDSKR